MSTDELGVRWMIRSDYPCVLGIDARCFPDNPWGPARLDSFVSGGSGYVAVIGVTIVGFAVTHSDAQEIFLERLGVDPDFRREGVGRALVERLIKRLVRGPQSRLSLTVRERNLGAQLFYRSIGFRAVKVRRDYYLRPVEDAYEMCLPAAHAAPAFAGRR